MVLCPRVSSEVTARLSEVENPGVIFGVNDVLVVNGTFSFVVSADCVDVVADVVSLSVCILDRVAFTMSAERVDREVNSDDVDVDDDADKDVLSAFDGRPVTTRVVSDADIPLF